MRFLFARNSNSSSFSLSTRRLSLPRVACALDNGNSCWSRRVQGSLDLDLLRFLFSSLFLLRNLGITRTCRFVVVYVLYRFPRSSDPLRLSWHGKVWCYVCLGNFANRFGRFVSYTHRCGHKPRPLLRRGNAFSRAVRDVAARRCCATPRTRLYQTSVLAAASTIRETRRFSARAVRRRAELHQTRSSDRLDVKSAPESFSLRFSFLCFSRAVCSMMKMSVTFCYGEHAMGTTFMGSKIYVNYKSVLREMNRR